MLKGLLGALGNAGEIKSLADLGKRYPNDGGTFSLLGLSIGANGDTYETRSKLLSPDHFVNFRWRDGGFARPGVRYFTEVDPAGRRAALYYFTTPTGGGLTPLNQHFITEPMYLLAQEFIARINQNSSMGHGACVGLTPPEIQLWNGKPSLIYCFAAGIDYQNCAEAHTNNDVLNSVGEAMADGAARMGAGLYDISHNEKKRSVEAALKAMPKSKVQKELKGNDLDKVIIILEDGVEVAGLTPVADGHRVWRLEGRGETGAPAVAIVTNSGHIVIETRLPNPVPTARRIEVMNLIDPFNMQLLGRMSFAVIDLDTGRAAVRTGVRVNKGIDKFEPQIVANMIAENRMVSSIILPSIAEVSAGKAAEAVFAQQYEQMPPLSESQALVMGGRFLFRL